WIVERRDRPDGGDAILERAGELHGHRRAAGDAGRVDAPGVDAELRAHAVKDVADEADVVAAAGQWDEVPRSWRPGGVRRDEDEAFAVGLRREARIGCLRRCTRAGAVEVDDDGRSLCAVVRRRNVKDVVTAEAAGIDRLVAVAG